MCGSNGHFVSYLFAVVCRPLTKLVLPSVHSLMANDANGMEWNGQECSDVGR